MRVPVAPLVAYRALQRSPCDLISSPCTHSLFNVCLLLALLCITEADVIRERFRKHKDETNPKAVAALLAVARAELEKWAHPDPYIGTRNWRVCEFRIHRTECVCVANRVTFLRCFVRRRSLRRCRHSLYRVRRDVCMHSLSPSQHPSILVARNISAMCPRTHRSISPTIPPRNIRAVSNSIRIHERWWGRSVVTEAVASTPPHAPHAARRTRRCAREIKAAFFVLIFVFTHSQMSRYDRALTGSLYCALRCAPPTRALRCLLILRCEHRRV